MDPLEAVKVEQDTSAVEDYAAPGQSLWSFAIQRARFVYQSEHGSDVNQEVLFKTLLYEINGFLIEIKNFLSDVIKNTEGDKIDALIESILSIANQTKLEINSDVSTYQDDTLFSPFEEVLEVPYQQNVKQEYLDDLLLPLPEDLIDYEDPEDIEAKPDLGILQKKPTSKTRSPKGTKRKYTCDKCGQSWANRSGFSYHNQKGKCVQEQKWIRWTRGRPLCIHPDCSGKEFSQAALMNHIIEAHSTPETSVVQCPECPASFPMFAVLRYHQDIVHQANKEICTICGAQVRDLRKHKWVHSSEKPYQCDKCNYRCNRPSVLKRHMYTHSEDANEGRVHKCDLCEKAFYGARELREHRLTHSKVKPYQCKMCNDVFSNYSGHRQHMMRAHGQKISCDICGKDSYSLRGLNIHKRDQHGVPM